MERTQTDAVTVSEYAARVQRAAKQAGSARIEGEVQKPKPTGGGAFMFDLTDGASRLRCKVLPWTRDAITYTPKEGDLVQVDAEYPDFWPKGGYLTIVTSEIELAGDGVLLRRRQELLKRLQAEGLTAEDGFPVLPRFPRAVGVIAGHDSSALYDVLACLSDRFPVAKVITACCPVQGAQAPQALIAALAQLELHPEVDVIVIARGGGSVQDLAAFDDEGLCRAIRAINTPTITAIGHTDNSPVCNHITHAAYVPRHAAERAVPDRADLLRDLDDTQAAADRAIRRLRVQAEELDTRCRALKGSDRVKAAQAGVAAHGRQLDGRTSLFLAEHREQLSEARELLARSPAALLKEISERRGFLDRFKEKAARGRRLVADETADLQSLSKQLHLGTQRSLTAHRHNWTRALDRQAGDLSNGARQTMRQAEQRLKHQQEGRLRATESQKRALNRRAESLIAIYMASDLRRRGWPVGADGRLISDYDQVRPGDPVRLLYARGEVGLTVESQHPYPEE